MELNELLDHIKSNYNNKKPLLDGLTYDNNKLLGDEFFAIEDLFNCYDMFTLAPRTHIVNGFEVPEPLCEAPAMWTMYWIEDATTEDWRDYAEWSSNGLDKRMLSRKLAHATEEGAIANAKARHGVNPYE